MLVVRPCMKYLPDLFRRNRRWAARHLEDDPAFFTRLCELQAPRYLWIGCADSRVPANEIVGLSPGELFVHRNVANIVPHGDLNALSVLQYAVDVLRVSHVIVCGHYGCGGVQAALHPPGGTLYDAWVDPIRRVRQAHGPEIDGLPDHESRWRRLCELNVAAQVRSICETDILSAAWLRGAEIIVHGWIYDLHDGLLRDLDLSRSGSSASR
jgi:carbonic anhydrase